MRCGRNVRHSSPDVKEGMKKSIDNKATLFTTVKKTQVVNSGSTAEGTYRLVSKFSTLPTFESSVF